MNRILSEAFRTFERKDFPGACTHFKKYLENRHEDWKARLWYAKSLSECNRTNEALDELKRVSSVVPESPVPPAFSAVVLFDAGDLESAIDVWESRPTGRSCLLGEALSALARLRNENNLEIVCEKYMQNGNPDVQGRFLHLSEEHLTDMPEPVLRDFLDEIGIGWPKYRILPPWLFQYRSSLRSIWRLMAHDRLEQAFVEADLISRGVDLNDATIPTIVAAAIMADRWGEAYEWARRLSHFDAYIRGESSPSGLRLYQNALACGMMLLMTGETEDSIPYLKTAITGDPSSYLPFYGLGIAGIRLDRWHEARRSFISVCERVNPQLAMYRWKNLPVPRDESPR